MSVYSCEVETRSDFGINKFRVTRSSKYFYRKASLSIFKKYECCAITVLLTRGIMRQSTVAAEVGR